ncbi:hypothetical protein HDZ31DRAFT_68940 [Schizophyllum fasciatum]
MDGTDSISDSVPDLRHLTALYAFLHVAGGLVGLPIIIVTVRRLPLFPFPIHSYHR